MSTHDVCEHEQACRALVAEGEARDKGSASCENDHEDAVNRHDVTDGVASHGPSSDRVSRSLETRLRSQAPCSMPEMPVGAIVGLASPPLPTTQLEATRDPGLEGSGKACSSQEAYASLAEGRQQLSQ